jgi:hypothetical protein
MPGKKIWTRFSSTFETIRTSPLTDSLASCAILDLRTAILSLTLRMLPLRYGKHENGVKAFKCLPNFRHTQFNAFVRTVVRYVLCFSASPVFGLAEIAMTLYTDGSVVSFIEESKSLSWLPVTLSHF